MNAEAAEQCMLSDFQHPDAGWEPVVEQDNSRDCMFDYNFRCLSDVVCIHHIHQWMELIVVTEGTLNIHIGNTPYVLSAGEAIYVEPYEPHGFASPQKNTCQILEAPTVLLQPFWDFLQKHRTQNRKAVLQESVYAYLQTMFAQKNQENPRSCHITYAQAVLQPLCQAFLESCRFTEEKRKYDDIYLGALNIISSTVENNPTAPLTLSSVARQLGVHPVTLSQRFSEKSQMTFVSYVQYMRVLRAVSLMKNGATITDAAFGAGFGSIRTFNRVFRAMTGDTPSAFLETMRQSGSAQYSWDRILPTMDSIFSIPHFSSSYKSLSKK